MNSNGLGKFRTEWACGAFNGWRRGIGLISLIMALGAFQGPFLPVYAAQVVLNDGIYTNQKAYREDVTINMEKLRDAVNEVEADQIKNGVISNDHITGEAGIELRKLGDSKGTLNSLLYDYIQGTNCVYTGTADQWYIGPGEIAIVGSDGYVNICRNTENTANRSVNTDLAGSQANGTYYGFAVDNLDGTYTAITRNAATENAGDRLVCTIVMAASGSPPAISTVTNTTYDYHTADAIDHSPYVKSQKTFPKNAATATAVLNQKIITGWGYVTVSGTTVEEAEKVISIASASMPISTIRSIQATYIGFKSGSTEPTAWTEFTEIGPTYSPDKPWRTTWGTYKPTANGFTFWVGACLTNTTNPAWATYLEAGYYGFFYTIIGD